MRQTVGMLVLRGIAIVALCAIWWLAAEHNEMLRGLLAAERERATELDDLERLERQLSGVLEKLPLQQAEPDWYRPRLLEAARRAGLEPPSLRVHLTDARLGEWALCRVLATTVGSYRDLVAFVGGLERATPRFRLERFQMERGEGLRVRATFELLVPVRPPKEG